MAIQVHTGTIPHTGKRAHEGLRTVENKQTPVW